MDLILDFNYFSFCNCNINPNPTHLPKHQILKPNHQFSQRIWYVECCSVHAHVAWNQKFRLTPVGDSASNAVAKRSFLSVFINQRCAECVCLYYGQSRMKGYGGPGKFLLEGPYGVSALLPPRCAPDYTLILENLAKTLVWKHEYDVKLWRQKNCTQTNDHHIPLSEPPHENFLRTPLSKIVG